MSFHLVLKRLQDAVAVVLRGLPKGVAKVNTSDLSELLNHYERLDRQARAWHESRHDAGVPAGYTLRLVPKESTEAFNAACSAAFEESEQGTGPCGVFMAGHRAMLAAAPRPTAAGLLPTFIPAIAEQLLTQDNRATAYPLFVVFQEREIVVQEGYGHERIAWVEGKSGDHIEASPEWAGKLERRYQACLPVPEHWQRLAMKEVDVFVTACFTEQGCKDYLDANGHNLRKPFIYVTGLYRNREMIDLRNWMMLQATLEKGAEACI